ncbi:hypothetical protein KIN20_032501 [Parelaphostrongylus tenuis]|uniref:Uncharacterized protein n=1 Tax=Parelaphostrongylus tenuis TaxID=148309 RepID=A0AAD5R6Z9_PARTN|nr:hypothetical protein KIN20_032501 [Parelaphostrongylus tenuis]
MSSSQMLFDTLKQQVAFQIVNMMLKVAVAPQNYIDKSGRYWEIGGAAPLVGSLVRRARRPSHKRCTPFDWKSFVKESRSTRPMYCCPQHTTGLICENIANARQHPSKRLSFNNIRDRTNHELIYSAEYKTASQQRSENFTAETRRPSVSMRAFLKQVKSNAFLEVPPRNSTVIYELCAECE